LWKSTRGTQPPTTLSARTAERRAEPLAYFNNDPDALAVRNALTLRAAMENVWNGAAVELVRTGLCLARMKV
jgi:hypothetical protein